MFMKSFTANASYFDFCKSFRHTTSYLAPQEACKVYKLPRIWKAVISLILSCMLVQFTAPWMHVHVIICNQSLLGMEASNDPKTLLLRPIDPSCKQCYLWKKISTVSHQDEQIWIRSVAWERASASHVRDCTHYNTYVYDACVFFKKTWFHLDYLGHKRKYFITYDALYTAQMLEPLW